MVIIVLLKDRLAPPHDIFSFFFLQKFTINDLMDHRGARKAVPVISLFFFLSLGQFLYPKAPGTSIQSKTVPEYWELRINLDLKGKYEVKEGDKTFYGDFTFTTEWIGCFEEDEDDFLMYSIDHRLLNWQAQEIAKEASQTKVLDTKDFPKPPQFELRYILKENDYVLFNFVVAGFDVPQSPSEFKGMLILPASAENTKVNPDNIYNPSIVMGTNKVQVPLADFFSGRKTTSFVWEWKDRKWTQQSEAVVLFDQSHDVAVRITIVPHPKK